MLNYYSNPNNLITGYSIRGGIQKPRRHICLVSSLARHDSGGIVQSQPLVNCNCMICTSIEAQFGPDT